jgi:hypothetical protein
MAVLKANASHNTWTKGGSHLANSGIAVVIWTTLAFLQVARLREAGG